MSYFIQYSVSFSDKFCKEKKKDRPLITILVTKSTIQKYVTKSDMSNSLLASKTKKCSLHFQEIQLYCYTDMQELCAMCLKKEHVKHHIEPIGTAKYNRLSPYWEKVHLELENLEESAKTRLTEMDALLGVLCEVKSRDLGILQSCDDIKTKLYRLKRIFDSDELDPN